MKSNNRLLNVIIILLASLSTSLKAQIADDSPSENFHMYVTAAPGGLSAMVETADLIVIGRIEKIINEFTFYGYDEEMKERYQQLENELQTSLGMPFIDYKVTIEEVLKNRSSGHLLSSADLNKAEQVKGSTVIFRKPSAGPVDTGIDMMLFLSINPDGKTYGVGSLTGQLYLADSDISYLDLNTRKLEIPEFSRGLTVLELSNAIKEYVSTLDDE